jgi:pilus assembly protein CpaE
VKNPIASVMTGNLPIQSTTKPMRESPENLMSTSMRETDSLSMGALAVIVIGPDQERRRALTKVIADSQASVVKELPAYPNFDDLNRILAADHDVIMIDLDSDPERALEIVENTCARTSLLTVMIFSSQSDPELLVRCMRAGAREFLRAPVSPASMAEALVRAAVRRDEVRRQKKTLGKLFIFAGAKGGSGVTTVASNFSLSLAKESGQKVALLDLNFHLGDAALALNLTPKFSIADALENSQRLDADLLNVLLTKHQSGLSVLAAPDSVATLQPARPTIQKLLRIARDSFDFVVVDGGSNSVFLYEALFEMTDRVYLVTQIGVPELRNANRFVTRFFSDPENRKLEVVLNRVPSRNLEIDEPSITKALTRAARWKIPNDFASARRAQNTGVPIVDQRSPISRAIAEMAQTASGHGDLRKKKRFGLFG